jgi:DnaJ family protein C protein 2
LIDPAKRKKYDSTLAFDDKIPSKEDIKSDDDFFTIFGKCFQNNARFSIIKPTPNIGDMDTPMK